MKQLPDASSVKKTRRKVKKKSTPPYSLLSNTAYTFREIWRTKKAVALASVLLIFLSPLISVLYALIPSVVVSSVEQGVGDTSMFLMLGGVMLAVVGLQVFRSLMNCWTEKYYFSLNYRYLIKLNRKAMVIDYAALESPHGQNMKSLAFGNVNPDDTYGNSNAALLPWNLVHLFSSLFGLTSYTAILLILNPLLVVVLLASTVIPYLLNQWFNKYCYERREEESAMTRKMVYTTTTKSNLKLVKDAIFYKTAKLLLSLYWKAVHEIVALRRKRARLAFFSIDLVSAVLILIQNAAAYAILIHRVLTGGMNPASFVFYFSIITGFASWFEGFLYRLSDAQRGSRQFCDLRVYLEMPDRYSRSGSDTAQTATATLPEDSWSVEFCHVSFRYPVEQKPGEQPGGAEIQTPEVAPWVLQDVSFRMEKGEKLALVGLNGAGKTTLVKLLCGLLTPTEGQILINGRNLQDYDRDAYFKALSVVFQDIFLLPLSVRRNITLCPPEKVDEERLAWCLREADIESWISDLPRGLDTYLVKSVRDGAVDMSGGQKQKLALARALYKGGRMMILDEPTAALDPIAENKMYLEYGRFIGGNTALFISHRLSSTRFCDRILLLEAGKVAESGTHDQLMQQNGKYAELFRIQAHYYQEEVSVHEG